jgi:transposase-like protein
VHTVELLSSQLTEERRLKGFPSAIEAVYHQATVQLCLVHLVRGSLQYINWKERRMVAQDRAIYQATTAERKIEKSPFTQIA